MSTSAAAPAAAPITGVINYSDMGYVLTTDPDDTLPDMDGFDRLYCGSSENGWTSPCEIRAGRDLAVGETLTACLIRQSDGKLIDEVTFTADSTKLQAASVAGGVRTSVQPCFSLDHRGQLRQRQQLQD